MFNATDIDWFVRNSYNTALKYYGGWPPEDVLELLQACLLVGIARPSSAHAG